MAKQRREKAPPPAAPAEPKAVRSIGDLVSDPHNARRHNPRNIGAIANSLQAVGAARSIVIDENDVILAGNGLVEAAGQVGIERVRVVEASGNEIIAVRRRGLSPKQKAELAIADNRTGELSETDVAVLDELAAEHGLDLASLDYTDGELLELREADDVGEVDTSTSPRQLGKSNNFPTVKVVLQVPDLGPVEEALAATGIQCRGDALLHVCKAFLDEQAKGQLDAKAQGAAAEDGAGRDRDGDAGGA
jgi:hypothetical protein